MNEESDGINENENNNSEVVILPERSHVEELLLSDQSQLREEQITYERKLDEKLKDLGLYEDDMTINQKEELLAVVVISCETAEQEENKRQLIREYIEGAQSLEEEIEFSFQESAWLAGEANLLCSSTITRSKDDNISPTAKISFVDGEASTSRKKSDAFDSLIHSERSLSRNSPDIFQDDTAFAEAFGGTQSSTPETISTKHDLHKIRNREVKRTALSDDPNVKIGISHPIVQDQDTKIETTEILDRQLSFQRQKLLLDKSMGCWKPCMSPKDKSLSDFRLKDKKEETNTPSSLQEKFNKYLTAFEKTASSLKSRRSSLPKVTLLSKPYVLMHHGSVAKKATKLDNYDYMIGVSEKVQNNEDTEENVIPCNTLTRAKSAFHRVKPLSHGKLVSFSDQNSQNETSSKITRSGMSYGSKRLKSEQDRRESSPEVILDESFNQTINVASDNGSLVSEKRVTFHEDVIEESTKKLPKFSNLRPDANKCKMIVPSPVLQRNSSESDTLVKNHCDSQGGNSERKLKKEEMIGNRSEKDDSSDSSSSLIDVETIIEDEMDDIVVKRKSVPGNYKTSYIKNMSSSKR